MNCLLRTNKGQFCPFINNQNHFEEEKEVAKLKMNIGFSNFFVIKYLVNFQNCIKTSMNQYKSLVFYFKILILSKNITKYSTKEP